MQFKRITQLSILIRLTTMHAVCRKLSACFMTERNASHVECALNEATRVMKWKENKNIPEQNIENSISTSLNYVWVSLQTASRSPISNLDHNIGDAMRKCVFDNMRTAKAMIRLRICAVWSWPLLSCNRVIGYYRMYEWRTKARI